jgi:hypothetical protein
VSHAVTNPLAGAVIQGPTGLPGQWRLLEVPEGHDDLLARPGIQQHSPTQAHPHPGLHVSRNYLDCGLYPLGLEGYPPDPHDPPFGDKTLQSHQRAAVTFARLGGLDREGCLVAGDPGTGKSLVALQSLWLDNLLGLPGLILGPKAAAAPWCDPDGDAASCYGLRVLQLEGGKTRDVSKLNEGRWFFLNYDVLNHWWPDLQNVLKPEWIIFDELHYLMHDTSERTKAAMQLTRWHTVRRRIGLTGSPLTNRRIDLWAMLYVLQPRQWGRTKYNYGLTFCAAQQHTLEDGGFMDYSGESNDLEFHSLVASTVLRFTTHEVGTSLPDQVLRVVQVPYYAGDLREYELAALDIQQYLQRSGKLVQTPSEVTIGGQTLKISRREQAPPALQLRMITELLTLISTHKACRAIKVIDELAQRHDHIVVFCSYQATASLVFAQMTKLSESVKTAVGSKGMDIIGPISGRVQERKRREAAQRFWNAESAIFVTTMKAVGIAINKLARASAAVAIDLMWDPSVMLQAFARVRRTNCPHREVEILVMHALNTIDDLVLEHLSRKGDTIASTLPNDTATEELARSIARGFDVSKSGETKEGALLDSLCNLLATMREQDEGA